MIRPVSILQRIVLLTVPAFVTIASIVQVFTPPVARATNCSGTCTSVRARRSAPTGMSVIVILSTRA